MQVTWSEAPVTKDGKKNLPKRVWRHETDQLPLTLLFGNFSSQSPCLWPGESWRGCQMFPV